MFRVLVVSSGDATGVNFCRSLHSAKGYHLVGVDTVLEDFHTSEADKRYFVKRADDDAFIDTLNSIIASEAIDLVYCADTNADLLCVFDNRDAVAATVFLPDKEDRIAEDKWATYNALRHAEIQTPDTVILHCPEDLDEFLMRHERVWLRRISGSGGAGSLATRSHALAVAWVDEHSGWGAFTAAQLLSKRTATWMGIWFDGALHACQLRERSGWKYSNLAPSGVTGITAIQHTFWDEGLHNLALRCVRAISKRPHGILSVDFTWGFDGVPYPTEIQPSRFYSSVHFLTAAGLNLPHIYCQLAQGKPPAEPIINPIRTEKYWVKSVDSVGRLMSKAEFEAINVYEH